MLRAHRNATTVHTDLEQFMAGGPARNGVTALEVGYVSTGADSRSSPTT
jgi:hypothetical protein